MEFDEQLKAPGLFDFSRYGFLSQDFPASLAAARKGITGGHLVRGHQIPGLVAPRDRYLTYRDFIKCDVIWQRLAFQVLYAPVAHYLLFINKLPYAIKRV